MAGTIPSKIAGLKHCAMQFWLKKAIMMYDKYFENKREIVIITFLILSF